MKRLVAVRHGDYCGPNLTDLGIEDIELLAKELQALVNDRELTIVHSTISRAQQTAEILAKQFGVTLVGCEELACDEHYEAPEIAVALEEILDVSSLDVLLTVGHFEAPSGLISHYREKYCDKPYECREILKGHALVLDFTSGNVISVPQ